MSSGIFFNALLPLILLIRSEGFKFDVTRDLRDTKALAEKYWSRVEITEGAPPEKNLLARMDVPLILSTSSSDIKIFFANDNKEILEVNLSEKVEGKFYTTPYRVQKTMEGVNTSKEPGENFFRISGEFPSAWLPPNTTRVSATLAIDGTYYNYYGIKNYKISIPDLMVVDEYKKFQLSL